MNPRFLRLLVFWGVGFAVLKALRETPRQNPQALGDGYSIDYVSDKGDGEAIYKHNFEEPLPLLVLDEDRDLTLEGGDYDVYDGWIVR